MFRRIALLSVCMGVVTASFSPAQASKKAVPDASQPLVHIVINNFWQYSGSGTIVQRTNNTYMILTNRHVVENRSSRTVIVYKNKKKYTATLAALPCDRSPPSVGIYHAKWSEYMRQSLWNFLSRNTVGLCNADIALLKLETSDSFPVVRIRSTPVRVREPYCAAGWTAAEKNVFRLTKECGVVTHALSTKQLFSTALGIGVSGTLLHGMSGGPMLDKSGALIGLVTMRKTSLNESCEECSTWKTTVDNTMLHAETIAQYRKSNWGVPAALACTFWPEVCASQSGRNSKKPIIRSVARPSTTPVRVQ
jgi:hypothetical protein